MFCEHYYGLIVSSSRKPKLYSLTFILSGLFIYLFFTFKNVVQNWVLGVHYTQVNAETLFVRKLGNRQQISIIFYAVSPTRKCLPNPPGVPYIWHKRA